MSNDPEPARPSMFVRLRSSRQLRILLQRNYGLYTLGYSISVTGSWMQRIALLWMVWDMTGSGLWLGILAMADMLPVLVIGPLAGLAADRWDRLTLTRIAQTVLVLIAVLLGLLVMVGQLGLPALLLLAAANGCMGALNQPAHMALVQNLVRREDVGTAVALNSVSVNLARLTGPAIAGAMIVIVGAEWIFLANAALTSFFVLILWSIHPVPIPRHKLHRSVLAEMAGGLVFAFNDRGIRLLLGLLFLGGVAIRSVQDLFPAFAERNFDTTATGLAVMTSALALGAIAAGITFGADTALDRLARRIAVSWGMAAVSLCALVFSPSSVLDMALTTVTGFFATTGVIGTQTFVQLRAPDAIRGRMLSVHWLISRVSPALGALAGGWAFDQIGLLVPVMVSSGLVVVAALLAALRIRMMSSRETAGP